MSLKAQCPVKLREKPVKFCGGKLVPIPAKTLPETSFIRRGLVSDKHFRCDACGAIAYSDGDGVYVCKYPEQDLANKEGQ